MDFSKLEAFLVVASTGKFTDAASQLFISQSALSKQMSKLEEELGVTLFTKTRNGVELTQAGWDFYSYARKAVHDYQDAKSRLGEYSEYKKHSLAVGSLPLAQEYGIEDALGLYWSKHPSVQIEYRERNQAKLIMALDTGQLDLAVVRLDLLDKNKYRSVPLLVDELVVVCPVDHPLAHAREVPIANLRNERFILLERESDITNRFLKECEKAGFYPNTPLHASRHRIVLRGVQYGLGISVMPRRMVEAFLSPSLVAVPLAEHPFTTIGLSWLMGTKLSPIGEEFVKEIRESLRNMGTLFYNIVDDNTPCDDDDQGESDSSADNDKEQ